MSLTMTPFAYIADSVVDRMTPTFLGSGSVEIALQRDAGQCDVTVTGVERLVCFLLLHAPWNAGK